MSQPSPKLVRTKSNVIPIGNTPNVAFGCFHLESFYNHGEGRKAWKTLETFYSRILTCIREENPVIYQTCLTGKNQAHPTLQPNWLCMQCTTIFSEETRNGHFESKGHSFFVESRNAFVYCMTCDDLVFDPQLERLRLANGSKKRKFEEFATHEEYRMVAANSTHVPCRAIGLRGFYNMGNTCFMSVVLQCLLHNPLIRAHFLGNGHNKDYCDIDYCVSCALDEIFTEFYSLEKTEGYGAVTMLQNTWKTAETRNSGLAGYEQQDAHEYMQFMLNALHSTNNGKGSSDCDCIIHQSFYGRLQSSISCDHCKNQNLSIEPFLDLSLDIPAHSKKKLNGDDKNSEQPLRLEQCLDRFIRGENLTSYGCRHCPTQRPATKQFTILKLPPVLCIHLKRFSHSKDKSSKLATPVKFPLKLDMMPYTTLYVTPEAFLKHSRRVAKAAAKNGTNGTTDTPSKPAPSAEENGTPSKPNLPTDPTKSTTASPSKPATSQVPKLATYEKLLEIPKDEWPLSLLSYHLSSVIVHKGEINSGHYVNYAREGNDWFLFDDSKVVLVNESEVLKAEAYLLLYVLDDLTPWIDD